MRYLSVCSGIEAATVAWHGMGWTPVAFSEIEKFPSQVLKNHYPSVQNMGDMTKFEEWNLESVELLVGGTPCQSFSVAGLRKGLDDPRGNLMLTYGAIAKRFKPKWLVWENVPGVLSSNGGRDFGTFLGMLAELGYGFAYRVLDAQYFGVAQRRRRVFVVGCLGDWRAAAAVLFERDSLCGNLAPSREKRKSITDNVGKCLTARGAGGGNCDPETANLIPLTLTYEWHNQDSRIKPSEVATTLSCNADGKEGNLVQSICFEPRSPDGHARVTGDISPTLNTMGGGQREPCVAIQGNLIGREAGGPQGVGASDEEVMYTLTKADVHGVAQPINFSSQMSVPQVDFDICQTLGAKNPQAVAQPIAFQLAGDRDNPSVSVSETAFCLPANPMSDRGQAVAQPIGTDCYNGSITGDIACTMGTPGSSVNASGPTVMQHMAVRRLTPVECERLQGFPDGYTNIRENCPDGPRYKALGNSMAVPVMRWIGQRISQINDL